MHRRRNLGGGAVVWLLVAAGLLAALFLSRGREGLDRAGHGSEVRDREERKADVEAEPELASPEVEGEVEVGSLQVREGGPGEGSTASEAPAETGSTAADDRPGHCEIGGQVELRSRLDCLSRGGVFRPTEGDDSGSFVTLDDHKSWREQRREVRRRKLEAEASAPQPEGLDPAEIADVAKELGHRPVEYKPRQKDSPSRRSRSYHPHPAARNASGSNSSDWIVCYQRGATNDRRSMYGTDYSSANRRLHCLGPFPKPADASGAASCRARGYSSRRLFKHETSARRWEVENCR